jgi:three-Cys-motif partner protein
MLPGMTEPILWNLEPHTAAKHRVLRAYLDAWIPVMAQQALVARSFAGERPRLLFVDGFAGPGRYAGSEPGSPLIMLQALLSHSAFSRLDGVDFAFLFIEHDGRRVEHLEGEIAALGRLPGNVSVQVHDGEFEQTFGALLDDATGSGRRPVPTFAFIDPFGYSSASMSLAGRLLDFPRCEVLFFLPLSFVHRFVGRDGQENALNSLFGCGDWRGAIPLQGTERSAYLLRLFESKLAQNAGVAHVRSFQLRTQDGEDYRLVFGLGHRKGLELAKDAMWKVDPVSGTSYKGTTESGQEVLFSAGDLVNTAPLLAELRSKFGVEWFTIEQAEDCTVLDTPFRIGQLRRRTLAPAEQEGVLEVERPGRSGFKGARMRFA